MGRFFSSIFLGSAVLLLSTAFTAQAQNTWQVSSGSFDVAGNWADNSVPGSGTFALVDNGGTVTMGVGVSGTVRNLLLGRGTGGTLQINGGHLTTIWNGTLGQNLGGVGVGTVNVSNGGIWDAGGAGLPGFPAEIRVGSGGAAGFLNILTGGTVNANAVKVGETGGGTGTLSLLGGTLNVNETATSVMWVGFQNTGIYSQTGGTANLRQITVGSGPGITGTATVSGGTMNAVLVIIGDTGTGVFTQTGGSVLGSQRTEFGIQGGTGTLDLQGGIYETGYIDETGGSGRVKLNGGTLRANANQSDFFKDFELGDVTVDANGGFIDTNGFNIGVTNSLSGAGRLTKLGTGTLTLTAANFYAGTTVRQGTLAVSGADATIANGSLIVGDQSGDNAFFELSGGKVTGTGSILGNQNGSTGTATVSSGQWFDGSVITVGNSGTGTLQINDGLVSGSTGFMVGNGGIGNVTIEDGTLQTLGNFTVGNLGTGTLKVDGGEVAGRDPTSQLRIGELSGGTGTVTVNAGTLSTGSNIVVGVAGQGTLVVNGGSVTNAAGVLGLSSGGKGTATVNGGSWNLSDTLTVGVQGQGTLNVNGGLVSVTGATIVAAAPTSGTINLTDTSGTAGVLATQSVTEGSGTGRINFDGGVLRAVGNESNFISGFETGDVTSLAGGATLDSNGFDIGVASPIGGAGGLTKAGLGTLTMTGTSDYSGATTVQTGKLLFNGSQTGSSAVTVLSGAELGGTGNFSGSVTVVNGATLSPGNGAGTLTVGSMILNNTSNLQFELGTVSDRVVVMNGLTLDGNLNVTGLGGFGPGSYTLFQYSGALTNNGLNLASVPVGRYYEVDTSQSGLVNLLVLDAEYWDGSNTTPNGVVDGGNGTWNNSTTNWTTVTGNTNFAWSGTKVAVFSGTAGTVNVAEAISVADIAFETDGYLLTGPGTLAINGASLKIITNAATAQIDTEITGAGGLIKAGAGLLTLTGVNSYTGATSISAGILALTGTGSIATSTGLDLSSGAGFDISGLGASGTSVGNLTGMGDVNLGSKSLSIGTDDDTEFGGVISGSGGSLVKTGSGTATFTGVNTYDGGTTIQQGTLALTGSGSLAATGQVDISSGAAFDISGVTAPLTIGDLTGSGSVRLGANALTLGTANSVGYAGVISGAGGQLIKEGSGTFTLSGTNTYSGGTSINAGALAVTANANLGDAAGTLTFNGGTLQTAGTFTMNRGTTLNASGGTLDTAATTTLTQQGVIGGAGILTKTGAGVLALTGANSYGGGTDFQAGQINIGNNSALGTGTLTVAAGTVLATDGSARAIANNLVVNGDFSIYPKGTLVNVSAFALNGNMDLTGGNRSITNPSDFSGGDFGEVRLGGVISNGGLTLNTLPGSFAFFSMTGASSNTYTGATDLQTGISLQLNKSGGATSIAGNLFIEDDAVAVVLQSEQIADNSIVTINGIGRLQLGTLSDVTETIGSLLGDGEVALSDATVGSTLKVGSGTFTGTITDGLAGGTSLEKIGVGVLNLSGASTYLGATQVTAGSLLVNNTSGSATGAGSVEVSNGALLGGAGSINGAVTMLDGSTLSPGTGTGILTLGQLTLNTGSRSAFELGAPTGTAGVDSDLLNVVINLNGSGSTGNLTIQAGSFFDLTPGSDFGVGTYRLFNYGGSVGGDPSQAFFSGIGAGYSLQLNTDTAGQVNLVVGFDSLQFWNDGQTSPDGSVHGGTGTWNNSSTNWTNQAGNASSAWGDLTAVFAGAAGTVTVTEAINIGGLQFATTGYNLVDGGGSLVISGAATEMRLDAGVETSIAAPITGSGGLMKTGDGTLTLAGTNSYSGGTLLNAGTLSISGDNNLGDSVGGVTFNGGTLQTTETFATSRAMTLNAAGGTFYTNMGTILTQQGTVSGTGGLTKVGMGTLIMDAANSYGGGTTVNEGTLRATVAGALGAGNITVNNGSFLQFDGVGVDAEALAIVTGSSGGLFFQNGATAGTASIVNSDGGYTTVQGNSNLGSATVTNVGNGGLYFFNTATAAGATVINQAGGGVDISGLLYDSVPGTEIGSLSGDGNVFLGQSSLTVGALNRNDVIGGSIQDGGAAGGTGGSLIKTGNGILTLTNDNTYSGPTLVEGGGLVVNGSLGNGQVTVGSGAFLGGNGRIGGEVVIQRGGTLSPGNSPGILSLGALTLQGGSTTRMEINGKAVGTQYDRLNVAGNANLNGTLNLAFGYMPMGGESYTLITAGSITPSGNAQTGFADVVANLGPTLGYTVTIDPATAALIVSIRQLSFTNFAGTPNETAVSGGLDRLYADQGTTPLINQLNGLNPADLRQALNQLAPDELAAMGQTVLQQFQGQFNNFNNRYTELRSGGSSISVAGIRILDPSGSVELNPQTMLAATGLEGVQGLQLMHVEPVMTENRWGIYLSGTGTYTDVDGDGNAEGYNFSTGGMTIGLDYRINNNFVVGFQSGYANTDANFNGAGGDLDTNSANWALTAGWMGDQGTYVHALAGGNYNSFDTERNVLGQKAVGSTEGLGLNTALVVGHEFGFGKDKAFKMGPEAAIKYSWLDIGKYTENGATGALAIGEQRPDSLKSRLGWRMTYNGTLGGVKLLPFMYAGWEHEYLNTSQSIAAAFPGSPASGFTVQGVSIAQDTAVMGLGITAGLTETISAKLSYDAEVSSDLISNGVNGAIRFGF